MCDVNENYGLDKLSFIQAKMWAQLIGKTNAQEIIAIIDASIDEIDEIIPDMPIRLYDHAMAVIESMEMKRKAIASGYNPDGYVNLEIVSDHA